MGPVLPPPQAGLEEDYRIRLREDFGIEFNNLLTITNLPINRFEHYLKRTGQLESYMQLLVDNFNPATVSPLMCRHLLSVDWQGYVFDCDFNQMLGLPLGGGTAVSEDGSTVTDTYTVALATEPTHGVTVTVTAGAGAQVNVSGGMWGASATLTFATASWSTAQTVTVRGVADSVDNPGGGRDVTIGHAANSTDPSYTIASAGSIDARVTDDDPTAVALAGAAGDIEEGQTKELTITLGRGLVDGEVLTVPLTFGGTATRGTDYTMAGTAATGVEYNNLDGGNATVVFTGPDSGATATTAAITLSAASDGTAESTAETVDIGLGTVTETGLGSFGGTENTDSLAAFGISDPPPGAGVTVSTVSLALTELGSSSTMEKTYTVVLDTDPGANVTITATNGDATAVEVDTDSGTTGNQNTLTFTAGGDGSGSGAGNGNWAVAQTVTVRALNDLDGMNESFSITHAATAASGAYNGISIDPVAVTTADAGHGVVVSKSSLSVAENDGTDTYTVVLKSRPSGNVVISATSGATARATVSPGTLTFGTSDWNTPKTFTVTGKGAGSTTISHAVDSSADNTNYPTSLTIPGVSVTVTADSRQVLDLSFSQAEQFENSSVTLTVTATGGSGSVTVAGGTALLTFSGDGIASSDYSFNTSSNLVLSGGPPPSSNIGISLANDNVDEPNETLVVGLQNLPAGYRAGTTASVTIVDRTPTTVTLAGGGTVMEDGSNTADVTVTLSRNLVAGETVTVPLAVTGAGIAAGDYTITPAPGSSLNRGVTLDTSNPHSAAQPAVVFTGHGTNTVQVATLRVTAVQDNTDEGASEALAVGFGSGNRAVMSNLDRRGASTGTTGTTTAGTATVTITDDDTSVLPVLSVALPSVEGVTRNTAGQQVFVEPGAGTDDPEVSFDLTLAPAPSADFAACIRVTETGGDRVAAADEGVKAVTVPDTGSLVHTVQWTDTAADDRDSVVTVAAVAPGTAGCSAASGTYTVSSTDASDSALVRDDDPTTVALTSSDTSMTEGDASNTATLTFTLGRQLYADEAVVVPFTLATTTGARLPGDATPDFAVTAAGTRVSIANANTATPSLTFTGHGSDTVRTATVTLTPVANRDDGDTAREEITATLAADSVLGSTSGSGTTVGGGAMRHGTDFAADLTLEDDEAPPGSVIFSVSELRLLENGSVTYTVRLNQEPTALVTAGVTPVGGDRGAVTAVSTAFFWPGTGSQTSWNSQQTITVTGVDEPGTHRNRATTIRYSLSSTDPAFNGRTFDLPVEVGDAPEVEAWEGWNRADGSRGDDATLSRPHTVESTPGIWPRRDFFPGGPLDYVVRLSNRPEPGGTVTVNVSRSNGGVQLGLTRNGPWRTSLAVTFGDGYAGGAGSPNIDACNNSHDWTRGGEAHDGTAATSWECWRKIWVRPLFWDGGAACTDLTHTASGGGVRSRTIETIRAHNPHYYRDGNRRCAILTPNTEPAALNAAAIQVPDTQVSNLVLEKTDSTSASASWDAVEHATGYEVSWDALDGDGQPVASGVHAGVTGTTETIEHDAPGAASLEVTVAPEHVDGNGDTQVSADLAATATLDLGTPQSAQGDSLQAGAASCDLGTLRADIAGHVKEQPETSDHVKRWKRVLAAFDGKAGGMTAAEARTHAGRGWTRWDPVVVALDCLEKAALPVVTVAGGAGVTEGSPAAFTVTATPAPSVPLTVKVTVGQGGDYAASGQTGARNVTVPTGGSATVQVATANDTADEPDGSVTATVEAGAGYTVGGAATATVTVADDDDPPANAHAGLIAQVREWRNDPRYVADKAHTDRWDRVLKAFGEPVADESLAPMTAAEAQGHADRGWSRWVEVAKALREIEGAQGAVGEGDGTETPDPVADPVVPELGLVAGDAVDEGGDAVFTVHADPAPEADLTVAFTVAQEGDWLSAPEPASRTLTLAAGKASAALTIATADDGADEADGSVRVTLDAGTGYTLADGGAAGTVAVRDNDTPAVGIAAGAAVTEGSPATFTLTANPAPHADLTVTLAVTQEGDHAAQGQTGARQATIPAGGSVAVEVATADDGADEADGRIAATVQAGSGYTVADPPDDAASVAVADDDEPVIGIAAGDGMADGVTEGGDAVFTLTADPAPHADLEVTVAVADDGKADFLDADDEGERRVVIPAGKATAEVRLGTADDSADEPDGSVTAALAAGTGYAVAAPPDDTATVAVADDDAAAVPKGPSLSVNDVEVKEGPYRRVEFTVTLSEAVEKYVSFHYRVRESDPVSAKRGVDFWASTGKTFAGMRPGQTEYRIRAAMVIDDSHDEDPETFEIVLSDAHGAAIADGLGVATIVNDDPMPAAWLGRFGRTVAQQALDGISDRMAAERTPGVTGTLAGHMDLGSLAGSGSGGPENSDVGDGNSLVTGNSHDWSMKETGQGVGNSHGWSMKETGWGFENSRDWGMEGAGNWSTREMTLREAVTGSSFTATGREDAMGGSLSFWGRGSGSSFDGREGAFTLDGDASTAMLGADYARDGWLLGLALVQSDGEGGYADSGTGPRPASQSCTEGMEGMEGMEGIPCDGAVRMGDGAVESTLTAAVPYGSLRVSDRIGLWGAFGHGTGEVSLRPDTMAAGDTGDTLASDITWTMASAGMRGDLLRRRGGKGPALALTADALWARTESDGTGELAASDSGVTRLRLGLEGSWKLALSGGGHVTPKLELGLRHDGGDAETGSGIELGAGVSWSSPATGIRLDLSGRTLVSHDDDDLEDRGFSADLSFDPDGNTGRGPSFSLRQELGGRSEGGLDALFAAGPLEDRAGSGDGESRWTLEGAWGFPAFSGRYTGSPHAGMGISGDVRDYSVGWRLAPESGSAPDLSFGVRATRREGSDAVPEHVFGFEAGLRW